ncbi:M12 family metallopeptidase [Leptothoe sp. EHU-05/26/07-4]
MAKNDNDLEKRLANVERQLATLILQKGYKGRGKERETYCSLPKVPPREFDANVSAERAELILLTGNKWVNGTKLHYYFFEDDFWGADSDQKDLVRKGFEIWKDVGIGLSFEEVSSPDDAEVRIGFQRGDGYWSYLGTYVLRIGQAERTMNFGQDLTRDPRRENVAVHEIGHTLGFPHGHQNPFAGIVWDREAVIKEFSGPPNNWPLETIERNILDKLPRSQVEGSEWDPNSIMHYAFEAGLILQPEEYQDGLTPEPGLSDTDREQVRRFYPPNTPIFTELKPFELQRLSIAPGQQRDFSIAPTATRTYTIQTFGSSDVVMVLFEEENGDYRYVAGDDDSGWDRNAQLSVRLYSGRRYVLRIRMYYEWASGESSVMLW